MNVVIDRKQFQKSLAFIRAVSGASGNVVVEGDAEGNVHLRALDLIKGLSLDLIVAGTVGEPGMVSAPIRNLPMMVKHMAESVEVVLAEDSVLFGSADRRLSLYSAQVPEFPAPAYDHEIGIGAQVFAKAMDLVSHSVSTGYDRPDLSAIALDLQDDEALLVGTDGFRLSIVELAADSSEFADDLQLLIPDDCHKLLQKMVKPLAKDPGARIWVRWNSDENGGPQDMTFGWQPTKATGFAVANVNSTVLHAQFPQWRRIAYGVRADYQEGEIDLRAMEAAVQAAAMLTAETTNAIRLDGQPDGVKFSSEVDRVYPSDNVQDKAAFEAVVPAGESFEGLAVTVNGGYLSKFLATAGRQTDRVRLSFYHDPEEKHPAPLFCLFNKARYLLMPMPLARYP